MALIQNFFDNISRIGYDNCDLTNKTVANTNANNYMLENYNVHVPMSNTINLATNQPSVFYWGSHEGGANGVYIDTDSSLKFSQLTKHKEKVSDQGRIFKSVPYLGKGPSNAVLESKIQNGDLNINRKSTNPNSEVEHTNHIYYPLIPSIEETVSNPVNLIEGVAYDGWIRGGAPSRLLNREQNN
jgi:hypothetical protein